MTKTSLTKNKISFNFDTMKFDGLTVSQLETWIALYPDVDVFHEISIEMARWLDKVRGTKKANKRNWKTFVVKWLQRQQLKAVL